MMFRIDKITSYFIILTTCCLLSLAYCGEYTFDFLQLDVGARECALGGASTSVPSSGFSSFWNPAAMADSKLMLSFMHASPFGLENLDFLSVVIPTGNQFGTGFSFLRIGISDISRFGEDVGTGNIGKFGIDQYIFFASFAVNKKDILIGINLKYLQSNLDILKGNGIGIDLGAIYRKGKFSLGVNLKNPFTSVIVYTSGTKDILKRDIRGGLSYRFDLEFLKLLFTYDIHSMYKTTHHIGTELCIRDCVFIRLGNNDTNIVGGGGVTVGRFFIDYAFSSHVLGPTHRVSGGVSI